MNQKKLSHAEYERLAHWRYALRRFLRYSQAATRRAGLSRSQHTLLLFVKVFPDERPSVADLAERLQVRHNSAVGLIDRCEQAGLVRRERDERDRRRIHVRLTLRAETLLSRLSLEHLRELATLREAFPIPLEDAPLSRTRPGRTSAATEAGARRKSRG